MSGNLKWRSPPIFMSDTSAFRIENQERKIRLRRPKTHFRVFWSTVNLLEILLPSSSMKSENLQFSDLAPHKNGEQPRCGASSGSVGLHPIPCTEQPANTDFLNPCGLLVRLFTMVSTSVTPQAVPARFTPAFWLSLVRSYHGGTSPERHIGLQPTMKLSRFEVVGQCPSYIESGKVHFARCFKNFFLTPIGIGRGRFIYSYLKFSKFPKHHEAGHHGCEMSFHRANRQKRTVLNEGMGSRIPLKMSGTKSPTEF